MERSKTNDQKLPDGWNNYQKGVKVIAGFDFVALYPSLRMLMAAIAAYEAMIQTNIAFSSINYNEAAKYIISNLSEAMVVVSDFRRVLPWKAKTEGSRPGMKNQGNMEPGVNEEKECEFKKNLELTTLEKKHILAYVVALGYVPSEPLQTWP